MLLLLPSSYSMTDRRRTIKLDEKLKCKEETLCRKIIESIQVEKRNKSFDN